MFVNESRQPPSPVNDKKLDLSKARHREMKSFSRWLIVATGLVTLTLIGGGYWFYIYQEQAFRENTEANLQAAAELKVNQIAEWRSEQLRDASSFMKSTFFSEALERFLADPQTELAEKILSQFRSIQELFNYRDVMLVDRDGQVHLSLRKHHGSLHDEAARYLVEALREGRPVMTDLHAGPADLPPHIDVVAPLFSQTDKTRDPNGAVILQIDARQFLYPLIQFWPTPSVSAETLLVRKEGEAVLFLNDLRHQPDTALKLRIPLSKKNVPAVMAVLGKEGILQGTDYRGVGVLSVLKAIPNSPWFMVSKMDDAEALAGWRFRSILLLVLVIALLAFLLTAVGVVWQRTRKSHYKELFLAETALRKAEEGHRITLMSVGDGIISTDAEGRVEILNPVAEALTGWRQEEARGKPLELVFRIFNEETRQPVKNPVSKALNEGLVVGLANHTALVAQDGTERPIADSAAPIRDEHGKMIGVVFVFRDQSEQRAAQRLLTQEKEQAQQYLDVVGVMLIALDTSGRVTLVNKKGCEILGYEEGDVLGKDWVEHFLPDKVRHEVKGYFSGIISGYLEMDEYLESVVLANSGEARLIAWHNSILRDHGGSIIGILSSGEDITDRKKTQLALRESEKQYRLLMENLHAGVVVHALDTNILFCNNAAPQLLGLSHDEMMGKTVIDPAWSFLREDESPMPLDEYPVNQVISRLEPLTNLVVGINRPLTKDRVWVLVNAYPVFKEEKDLEHVVVTFVDITARKAMEESLRIERDHYADVVNVCPVGIYRMRIFSPEKWKEGAWLSSDEAPYAMEMVSDRFCKLLGVSRETYARNPGILNALVHPEDKARFAERHESAMSNPSEFQWEGRIVTQGEIRALRFESIPRILQNGDVIWTGFVQDITDRKHAEELALQSARLRAVADLSSGVAHHFNNLLQIVMASTSLSLADLESGDLSEIKATLEKMLQAAKLGAETVKRLQTFADMRADVTEGESAVFDIATTARNVAEVSKPVWKSDTEKKGIKIDLKLDLEDGCLVKGQENEIFEVIVNLIRNAAEAMPQVGDIEVKTHREADEVIVQVRDTGTGIAEEDLSKVFQPFWSSKGVGIGKGMGLAVTHGLVKRHGGAISVDSKMGVGTTFTIRLPLAQEPVAKLEQSSIGTSGDHLTILVIDDDVNIASLLERICAKEGHTVYGALSGQEGLEIFKKEAVDLVISDLGMPGMNGWDVGKAIRSICQEKGVSKPPFILLTGYGGQELEKEKIARSGIDAVVAKPIDRATVLATVQEIGARFSIGSRVP